MQLRIWISLLAVVFSVQLQASATSSSATLTNKSRTSSDLPDYYLRITELRRDSLDDPKIQSHVTIRENRNIALICKAEGFPEPRITWRREDGQPFAISRRKKVDVSQGEQLTMYKIERKEMGAYLCIASNGVVPSVVERIIIDVEFAPMLWIPNQLVAAPRGTPNVTLQCISEAFPRANTYWMYDNKVILTKDNYHTDDTFENTYRKQMRLTIRNLGYTDFGMYRCVSKNHLGESEGVIRLAEIRPPNKTNDVPPIKDNSASTVSTVTLNPILESEDEGNNQEKQESLENSGAKESSASIMSLFILVSFCKLLLLLPPS